MKPFLLLPLLVTWGNAWERTVWASRERCWLPPPQHRNDKGRCPLMAPCFITAQKPEIGIVRTESGSQLSAYMNKCVYIFKGMCVSVHVPVSSMCEHAYICMHASA